MLAKYNKKYKKVKDETCLIGKRYLQTTLAGHHLGKMASAWGYGVTAYDPLLCKMWYITMLSATCTFSDSPFPYMGRKTAASQAASTAFVTP